MVVNYNVFTKSLQELDLNALRIINTINPHSYCLSRYDRIFNEALNSSDILLPDGTGIVLAARILNNQSITKIAGADIHQYLLQQANLKKDPEPIAEAEKIINELRDAWAEMLTQNPETDIPNDQQPGSFSLQA